MKVKVGDIVTSRMVLNQEDLDSFAELSGDDNPIHVDPAFAAQTRFGKTVAHGMLLYGSVCGLLNQSYPMAVQLEQELMFPKPTYCGQEITIQAEVKEVQANQSTARLATLILNPDGEVVCDGQTLLWWPG